MKAVVIGGSGQIGSWLIQHLVQRGHNVVGTFSTYPVEGLSHVDLENLAAAETWLAKQEPDIVFYPAGFTWVDGCERDPGRAIHTNQIAPLALARSLPSESSRFVYFSTDYVFDGNNGPYDESDEPSPINVYGHAKLEAEQKLTDLLGPRLLILRTTWVYGPERQGKNFAYQLVQRLSQGQIFQCPIDQISTPSYAPDVAMAAVKLGELGSDGLFHVGGSDVISRFDFANAVAQAWHLDVTLIEPMSTEPTSGTALRPLKSGLVSRRLGAILGESVVRGLAGLSDMIHQIQTANHWSSPGQPR